MGMLDGLKITIILMLFYSFAITIVGYTIPSDMRSYVTGFGDVGSSFGMNETAHEIQDSLERQTRMPLIDMGALVFYSGNIILDLLLNFVFAIPQMIALLLSGLAFIFNFDSVIVNYIQLFISVVIMALYLIGIVQGIMNMRSGSSKVI